MEVGRVYNNSSEINQGLDRGLRIFDEIAAGRTTLTQIAESLGVHKTTVRRLLNTMIQHHLVHRVDEHHYQLGRRLFELAAFALESRDLVPEARPQIQDLSRRTNQAVYLALFEGNQAVVVYAVSGQGVLHKQLRVGSVIPLHATAGGKVLAATFDADEWTAEVVDPGFERFTEQTRVELVRVADEIANVKLQGFASEYGEHVPFYNAIAAPIRDFSGNPIAALCMALPSVPQEEVTRARFTASLLQGADNISTTLFSSP